MKAAVLVCFLVLTACAKEDSGQAAPVSTGGPSEPASTPSATETALGAGQVLTPEDVEAETEHRITEQNLERELDRLEREIQAE